MTDHVTATLDGAVPAPAGAMRWTPPPDWGAVLAAVGNVLRQLGRALRRFFDELAQVWNQWLAVIAPILRAVDDIHRRRLARLSAMRRAYHRRRR